MMNIRIKPEKKRYIIYAVILALFSSAGMQISLLRTNISKPLKLVKYPSTLDNFLVLLKRSISLKGNTPLFFQAIALIIFIMFLVIFSYKFSKKEIITCSVMGVLFGICMWIGTVFSHKESWDFFIRNKYVAILNIFYIAVYALFAAGIFLLIVQQIKLLEQRKQNTEKAWSTKKVFGCCVLTLLIFWLPYYIVFWPGFQHGDVPMQILQYFHLETIFQGRVATDGINIIYSNDHPFIMTQFVGAIIKFGLHIHNLELAYGLYSFLQMLLFIIGYSSIITSLYKFSVRSYFLKLAVLIYAVFPVFPLYALLLGGDSFFSVFFTFYMTGIVQIYGSHGAILKNNKFIIAMIGSIFLMAASKNQGVYVAAVVFLVSLFYFKKYRKQIFVSMLTPILLFQFVYQGLFFQYMHVGQVGKQEALSFCFQQTARYVKYHKDEVTKEEEENIDKVLDYKSIGEKYVQELSDPVKSTYKEEATSTELKKYFISWFKMGLKHPGEYLQAFLGNTYGYYCPAFNNKKGIYLRSQSIDLYLKTRKWAAKRRDTKTLLEKVKCEVPTKLRPIRQCAETLVQITYKIPVICWLYNPGTITWLMFMGFFVLFMRKKYNSMLEFLPVFLIFGVCLLSPKNNNLRYIYPTCSMLPAMLATAFGKF